MKPVDIGFSMENNEKDSKLEFGGYVKISKYKKIFAKVYAPNWSEKVFVIKKVKRTLETLKAGTFYKK